MIGEISLTCYFANSNRLDLVGTAAMKPLKKVTGYVGKEREKGFVKFLKFNKVIINLSKTLL